MRGGREGGVWISACIRGALHVREKEIRCLGLYFCVTVSHSS